MKAGFVAPVCQGRDYDPPPPWPRLNTVSWLQLAVELSGYCTLYIYVDTVIRGSCRLMQLCSRQTCLTADRPAAPHGDRLCGALWSNEYVSASGPRDLLSKEAPALLPGHTGRCGLAYHSPSSFLAFERTWPAGLVLVSGFQIPGCFVLLTLFFFYRHMSSVQYLG